MKASGRRGVWWLFTYRCGLEREAEGQRQNVPVFLRAPSIGIDAIVWVQKHDETGILDRGPNRVKCLVIKPISDPFGPHDHSFEMGKSRNLVHGLKQGTSSDFWDEREESEPVKSLDAMALQTRPSCTPVFQIVVEFNSEGFRLCSSKKIEPRVCGAVNQRSVDHRSQLHASHLPDDTDINVVLVHELDFFVSVPILPPNGSAACWLVI